MPNWCDNTATISGKDDSCCDDPGLTEVDYIYFECDRQHVGNYGDFAKALQYAKDMNDSAWETRDMWLFVQHIANIVEPDVNVWRVDCNPCSTFRASHVGFMGGGSAAPTNEVPRRFTRWCFVMSAWMEDSMDDLVTEDQLNKEVESLVKQLLDIHPWADGNGRTASILRNWMFGTLENPSPLPYYYE